MENNFTFIASKALDDPEVTKGTLLWHLFSGEKTPIASISHRSIYGGDYCSATVEYNGGSLSCSAWCDHITGKGALPFTDSSGNTVAVLRHKYTLATNERWTMEYDGDIYPITVTQDSVSHKKTILVYDPVPEQKGEVLCFYPLAYIEYAQISSDYSGLVTQRLPMELCMAIVWLPFVIGIARTSK